MSTHRRRAAPTLSHFQTREVIGVDDMVLLTTDASKEAGVVENLRKRLQKEQIYTHIGDVLICVNPYKWLDIYDDAHMKQYVHKARMDAVPHIYSTAEAAFRGLITEEDSQCVIISGESGAGKTEASKQIQTYIAAVSGGGIETEQIKRIFLESNPVLEAFGNAKTLRNNNSSRFGKYFELKFDRFGNPSGGYITNYLLEKSRICKPGPGERNFHCFYQLLASKYAAEFQLGPASDFTYLNCSKCQSIEGVDERVEFDLTWQAIIFPHSHTLLKCTHNPLSPSLDTRFPNTPLPPPPPPLPMDTHVAVTSGHAQCRYGQQENQRHFVSGRDGTPHWQPTVHP